MRHHRLLQNAKNKLKHTKKTVFLTEFFKKQLVKSKGRMDPLELKLKKFFLV